MKTQKDLFAALDALGIAYETVEHPPMFTVEDGLAIRDTIPGLDCKNLFLKDKKGQLWLIVLPADKRARLSEIEKTIGAARLSFGKPELLFEVLGVPAGSVTPFALINDTKLRLTVVLDSDMMAHDRVNFHPLRNTASTCLKASDLLIFIKSLGYSPLCVNCGTWIDRSDSEIKAETI